MGVTNAQYDELMRQYDRRRLAAVRTQAERRREVEQVLPGFSDLDRQAASESLQTARALLNGDTESQKTLLALLDEIARKRERMLLQAGFPADYLEIHYQCPDCGDTGYVGGEKCHCLRQAIVGLLYRQSHLEAVLAQENFDTFDLSLFSDTRTDPETGRSIRAIALAARDLAWGFVRRFDTSFENLLLTGSPGTGKTFLSNCIAKALLDNGHSVLYISAVSLEQQLLAHERGHESEGDPELLRSCDLLIIDDLGSETVNSLTASLLFDLLNDRWIRKKSTLISSNKSALELAVDYSDRIYSRLMGHYQFVPLSGPDLRILKQMSQSTSGNPPEPDPVSALSDS